MNFPEIYSATGMMELIQKIGFLPLLDSGIEGFSAEDIVAEDCRYVTFPKGGWDWPLWKWKGEIVQEMPCMYGKFFNKKAGFISQEWWPDFCNYRRSKYPRPDEESIEGAILSTLQSTGSLITRELRAACGFTGKGMRSKFDGYLTRLEMATYIVTEDFIYLVTSIIMNMAGDGRCSILPKISMAGRLANATELPRNLIRGFSNI